MSGLTQRIITAVFFVAIMVAGIFTSPLTLVLLFGVVTAICLWEFLTIVFVEFPKNNLRRLAGVEIGLLPYIFYALYHLDILHWEQVLLPFTIFVCCLFLVFIYELFALSKTPYQNIGKIMSALVYIGLPFTLLLYIALFDDGFHPNIIFGMLWLTWTNDTCAYFTGSWFGKNKLFPQISPKKTWEGSIGGVIGTMIMGFVLSQFFTELTATTWIAIAATVAIFGSIGDLIESMLKRSYGIKDSGTLLPGHGGFLDRFDAFIFLIPFVLLVILLF